MSSNKILSRLTFYLPISNFKICLNISAFLFFVLFLFSLKKKCLFPTNVKIHLSDKVNSTYTLSPGPLQHFSEVNRVLEVVPVVGAVVPPRFPLQDQDIQSCRESWWLRAVLSPLGIPNSWREPLCPGSLPTSSEKLHPVTCRCGPVPLLQGGTAVKSCSSPKASGRVGWDLCCSRHSSVSPWPLPASRPPHTCCFWGHPLVNLSPTNLSHGDCFLGNPA